MIRLIVYSCLAVTLSACSVGPDYVKPQAVSELPASFKEMPGWKVASPQDRQRQEKWWETYQDVQLNSLEERLLRSNQTLKQAEAQYQQAQALIQSAKAGYYPSLSLGASATR